MRPPTRHVVCVGDVMVDVVARLPGPLALGSDTPARIELYGGGSAANTASWLASLGTPTTLLARIGPEHDPLRAVALEALPAVIAHALAADDDRPTGRCLVLVSAAGERTMVPDAGANARLVGADLGPDHFRPGRHLHLSGYVLFGPGRAAGEHALALARAAGMTISVDASSAAPLATLGAERFLDMIGPRLLLFANLSEALILTDRELADGGDAHAAARHLARRLGEVIVKCGADGAIWSDGTREVQVNARSVDTVDTTGAGDAFAAGFLHATGGGRSINEALQSASEAAARACARVGGRA
jgi:ribokinase